MSLTDELRSGNSVFRKFLEENFPILNYLNKKHPQFKRTRELLNIYVPKTIVKYDGTPLECSLIGAAMDYRVRMFFKGFDVRKTVAARGIERPKFVFSYGEDDNMFFFGGPAHHRVGLQFLNDHYGKWRSEFRRRTQLTEAQERELCRDCYLLACYEQVARGMPSSRLPIWQHNGSSIRLLRALVSEDNVESIFFLAKLFRQKAKSMHGMDAVLNPTFSASKLVFGADADLILADTLIELKTINDLPVWKFRQMVTQTLSYYLLDINDAYQVQSIGIYFLRKAWFWKSPIWYYFFPPEDVFRHLENGTRPRAEVVRRAVLVKRSALQGLLQARYQRWMDQRAAIVAN